MTITKEQNRLINEKSPYLLQHANNPVDWYPWGNEAFKKAKDENKPVFLSIGYSTCHWCHVMAHESFEDIAVAKILNEKFVSIKVDKEERPDVDSIYMNVCQMLTGSGGWPTTIFMTPEQKPFFAGTYFPKKSRMGMIGFTDLILSISQKWGENKAELIESSNEILKALNENKSEKTSVSEDLVGDTVSIFKKVFDETYGGFGNAPKFPSPHNLMFLMNYYKHQNDKIAMAMVEKTLLQMYKGGIFDHIGFGFSRYSTDRYFLVPHFEKMLYDNALLMISYTLAYDITKNELYKTIAQKTATYCLRELTHPDGGFYCAQDADSEGVEGKYYALDYDEITSLLGNDIGEKFNSYYGITKNGNFDGKNIPNLLSQSTLKNDFEEYFPLIYQYRKTRTTLHLDDKILTSWNSLMISAFAVMYRVFGDDKYIDVAKKSCTFINKNLSAGDKLFVSYRNGKVSSDGFLDDYAFYIYALINMYEATLEDNYLERAIALNNKTVDAFYDKDNGGFFLYGDDNEQLISKPKETYDGAIPSGNSVMAYNLIKLFALTNDVHLEEALEKHINFMSSATADYPTGNSFYLLSLLMYTYPQKSIVCVLKNKADKENLKFPLNSNIKVLDEPNDEYKLVNNKTTFYVCENHSCKPPTNELTYVLSE